MQSTLGNQAVQRMLQNDAGQKEAESSGPETDHLMRPLGPLLQRRSGSASHGDVYEREANQVTNQVTATLAPPASGAAPPHSQRFTRQPTGQMEVAPASVERVLASSGRPLEPALRTEMEQRFGHDFSAVRVHLDRSANQSADELNAAAYTSGRHIVFAHGRFAPMTPRGRHLLAHELTHVVQQHNSTSSAPIRRAPADGEPKISRPPLPSKSSNQVRLGELIHAWVPNPAQQRNTTISRAAAVEVKTGRLVHLIAIAGEGANSPLKAGILQADEILVPRSGPGSHAEIDTIRFAQSSGYEILPGALEPSRAFCTNCAFWARKHGVAPPNATVRVGSKEKQLADVSNKELATNLPAKRERQAELTQKGKEKRAAAAAKKARTAQPAAPVEPPARTVNGEATTPIPPSIKPTVVRGKATAARVASGVGKFAIRGIRSPIGKMAGAAAVTLLVLPWLTEKVAGVTKDIIDDQIKKLQPQIDTMIMKEAAWGIAAYNRHGRAVKLYINVTLDVAVYGVYEGELYDYVWSTPAVSISSVEVGTERVEGPRRYKSEFEKYERNLGTIIDHNHVSYSIPLDDLIEDVSQ